MCVCVCVYERERERTSSFKSAPLVVSVKGYNTMFLLMLMRHQRIHQIAGLQAKFSLRERERERERESIN